MHLTKRETAALALIAQGMSDRAIAHALDVTLATARKHRENIQQKLNVSKAALLVWHHLWLNPVELKKSCSTRHRTSSLHVSWKFYKC